MMKKMTALLLALVLCVGLASTAMASKGPYASTMLMDDSSISFARWTGNSFGRAAATWVAMIEMKRAGLSVADIDLSKPSYVGLYGSSGSLDIFLPTSEGYLNPCFGKDGSFTVYEYSTYTPSKIESKYPTYRRNDRVDLLQSGCIVYDGMFGI